MKLLTIIYSFRYLYTAFVRSIIETSQAVWFPNRKGLIKTLEQVQIRATSLVDGLKDIPYEERLRILKLHSLHYRRIRGDMIETWKHFNEYDKRVFPESFKMQQFTRPIRNKHELQLVQGMPTRRYGKCLASSFYYRVPRLWNKLPAKVVNSKTINAFKNSLDEHWKDCDFMYDWWSQPPELPEGYIVS